MALCTMVLQTIVRILGCTKTQGDPAWRTGYHPLQETWPECRVFLLNLGGLMFETVDEAEIPISPIFGDDGTRAWSYVGFPLALPWFYVNYLTRIDGGSLRRMLCLTRVDDLLQLSQGEEYTVAEVNIVVPSNMSGRGRWTMEPLAEIWSGTEPEAKKQTGYVFVTASGVRYLHSGLSDRESELLGLERIFQAPTSGSPS